MTESFIGEIQLFAGNFAPADWAFCDGRLLQISENDALFALIGTTYGGDGQTTFALPDLRGRVPIHRGAGPALPTYAIGQSGGVEEVTLLPSNLPSHSHGLMGSATGGSVTSPTGQTVAQTNKGMYKVGPAANALAAASIGPAGQNQPHNNLQPFLCLNFIISLFGIFPSRS